jgi:hypothetical protein
MYCDSKYKNDLHLGDLYVKRRVANYRGENVENIEEIKNEMEDTYMKLYNEHVIDGKLPPAHSCYYQIRQYYIEHSGVDPPKEITFNKYPDKIGCVQIFVEIKSNFENFVEYMFRKLGKDIIACVGIRCGSFEKLKEMNVMIPEMHEMMWEEKYR